MLFVIRGEGFQALIVYTVYTAGSLGHQQIIRRLKTSTYIRIIIWIIKTARMDQENYIDLQTKCT